MFAVTEIKYRYLGNNLGIKLEEGKYPLSHVLGYVGYNKTVSETSPEEVDQLNVKYSKESLQPIIKMIQAS